MGVNALFCDSAWQWGREGSKSGKICVTYFLNGPNEPLKGVVMEELGISCGRGVGRGEME